MIEENIIKYYQNSSCKLRNNDLKKFVKYNNYFNYDKRILIRHKLKQTMIFL